MSWFIGLFSLILIPSDRAIDNIEWIELKGFLCPFSGSLLTSKLVALCELKLDSLFVKIRQDTPKEEG